MPADVADADIAAIRDALVDWYRRQRRDLPWRRSRDPYAIWVSEVMLQQTRVDTVTPRWTRWMARFPSVRALADAAPDEVLAEWAGLGYYARARNLHQAAREVAERYGGVVPDDVEALRALPGVGRYTAGAVASIAYGRRAPVLDGNVMRVLARLFSVEGDARGGPAQRRLWSLAGALVEAGDPGEINQAAMELGATLCAPQKPTCLLCPVTGQCAARKAGRQQELPSLTRKTPPRALDRVSVALRFRGEILLARCPPSGLWGGLYELPSDEPAADESHADAARRVARERAGIAVAASSLRPLLSFEHVLTHRRITFHAFAADLAARSKSPRPRVRLGGYDAHAWATPAQAAALGVSTATTKLLAALATDGGAPATTRELR